MSQPSTPKDLERVIDSVIESYQSPHEINNLDSAMLPHKDSVISGYLHLRPVLFMGFFTTRSLTPSNLRFSISAELYPAHELLTEQIRRAYVYRAERKGLPLPEQEVCEQVVLRLFAELPAIRTALARDCRAAYDGDPAAGSIEEVICSYPAIDAIVAHRIAHVLYREGVPMLPRIISEYAHGLTGIDINPGAMIGPGFFIDHGTGVVIGETAVLGERVKLYQGVTLGALSVKRCDDGEGKPKQRHPTIEDDVTIYAGATILGAVVIGKGSVIGGNVWITENVEPGTKISIAPPQLTIFKSARKAPSGWELLTEGMRKDMLASAEAVLSKALAVQKNETILLVYDKPTENVARAFLLSACEQGLLITPRMIEVTPSNGSDPDPETVEMMLKHNVVIGATFHSLTHCNAMVAAKKHGARGCTLPGISDDMFTRAMKVDPAVLQEDGKRWAARLGGGKRTVRITTEKGTDIEFTIGSCPVQNDAASSQAPGIVGNIPAGEVYTVPDPGSANGRIVIDASIGSILWEEGDPDCAVVVRNGSAVSFEGDRGQLLKEKLAAAGEKGFVMAEFGIGTNPFLKITGNLLEDEKVKGTIHLAFGNNCAMGGTNQVPVHIDGMVCKPNVFVDGECVMEKGVWKV